ncbi:DUF11 domain-containing protein, partial [Curtobacterium sp. VKM Ac-2852]
MRSKAFYRALAVAGVLVAATFSSGLWPTSADPAYAATGDPFPASDPTVFVAQAVPTRLYKAITDSSGNVNFTPEGPAAPVEYNALAYNTADNYLYAIVYTTSGTSDLPANSLVRIGQGGALTRVGNNTYPTPDTWDAAAFGGDGYFYIGSTGSSDNTTLEAIDVTTGSVVKTVTLNQALRAGDFAFAQGFFWGQTASGGQSQIQRIDPATGNVSVFDSPVSLNAGLEGAAWTYGNGNLGFSRNSNGEVSQVAVQNPASAQPVFTLVSTSKGPSSARNDGAASPGQFTDLAISKSGPSKFRPGDRITYNISVLNNGPSPSSGYTVKDDLPSSLTNIQSTSAACSVNEQIVTCTGGQTASGDSETFTISATTSSPDTTLLTNSATVLANEDDPDTTNNTASQSASPVGLDLVKKAGAATDVNDDGLIDAGDTIPYTFTVTNIGSVPVSEISVDDKLLSSVSCPAGSLSAGSTTTCTSDKPYVITNADEVAGSVVNTATASGTASDGSTVTTPQSRATTVITAPAPALTIDATASKPTASAGQKVDYTFTVTNSGNVTITDLAVASSNFTGTGTLSDISCPTTTLAVGANTDCTATYTLTQADINAGSVSNTVTANGTAPSGSAVASSSSTAVVTLAAAPA